MPALALTDLSNLFGLVKFYQEARKKGIKPIIGCDVWISNEADRDKPARILLLVPILSRAICCCAACCRAPTAKTSTGDARKSENPGLSELMREAGAEGLIALSGANLWRYWPDADAE